MKEFWLNVFLLMFVIFVLTFIITPAITGFNTLLLSVKSNMGGELFAFLYEPIVNVSKVQTIYVEFVNIGSESYQTKIEEFIYFYDDSGMNQVAYYYDSTIMLYPGMRRPFETKFVPSEMGFYYIKVRVTLGTKRMESWGSFYATFPEYSPYVPAEYQPITIYAEVEPLISLDYPKSIEVYPGRSVLTNIRVKNIGNATLHEVKLHLSTTNFLEIDLNPKESYYLDPNETLTFLLDVYARNDIPISTYPIDFELITRELKERGTIMVNVSAYNLTLEEEVRKTILNYEYLIAELQREILDASAKEINVTLPQTDLDLAKTKLEEAKLYYEAKEYEKAKEILEEVKELIKESAFKLAQASFTLFIAPAFSPIWILIIVIILALVFFFIQKRRKERRKPKLLRSSEEAKT